MLFGSDCLFICSAFILTFLLGLPFLYLVPATRFKNKYLITTILGYGFVSFLTTVTYRFGVSHLHLYHTLWGFALLICFVLIYKKDEVVNFLSLHTKTNISIFLIWLLALIIILIPYWVGGLRFSVFQGWIWDQFSYLGTALTYDHETFKEVNQSSGEFFLRSPISIFGAVELYRRPAIEHLFGLLTDIRRQEMYRFGYLFLTVLVANGILAATFLITNVFKCSIYRAMTVSIAIFIGFWGQSFIDFDAWSMTGAMPLLLAVVTYVIIAARNIQNESPLRFVELLPLGCLIGFALYIYPENTMFHIPALLTALLSIHFVGLKIQKSKISFAATAKVLLAILLGLSLSLFYFQGTIGHFIWAATFSAQNLMTQAVYGEYLQPLFGQANWFRPLFLNAVDFSNATVHTENQAYVLLYILKQIFSAGHLELIYYTIIDGFYGFFGMYFLTPLASLAHTTQEYWRALLTIILVLFLWVNFKSYKEAATKYRLIFLVAGVLVGMLLFFFLTTRIYAMARGLYFLAPYAMILFFVPLLLSNKIFTLRNSLLILAALSQFGFGLARIDMAAYHVPHYPLPYSFAETYYFPDGKKQYDWNISRFDSALKSCHRIYVDVPNGWHEYAVIFYLYSKNKNFVKKIPVQTSYWGGVIGQQILNGKEDCAFSVTKKILADKTEFNELVLTKLTHPVRT